MKKHKHKKSSQKPADDRENAAGGTEAPVTDAEDAERAEDAAEAQPDHERAPEPDDVLDGIDDDPPADPPLVDETELDDATKVQMLQEQLEAAAQKYVRARADLDNLRKRKAREIEDVRRNTKVSTLEEVLPVMDQFQMAVSAIEQTDDVETIKQGMSMIEKTFQQCLANLGVEQIATVGEHFDPNLHEAIATEPSDDVPEDHVIREWKAGYKLGKHLLRAPVVVVSKGAADDVAGESEADADASADGRDEDASDNGQDESATD
jgi:molecular chaperone GrpE